MSNPLMTVMKDGLVAQWAAKSDPDRPMLKEFAALQMSTTRDETVDSRLDILERIERKIEKLIADGANGRTVEAYQHMHEQLAAQVIGGNR